MATLETIMIILGIILTVITFFIYIDKLKK